MCFAGLWRAESVDAAPQAWQETQLDSLEQAEASMAAGSPEEAETLARVREEFGSNAGNDGVRQRGRLRFEVVSQFNRRLDLGRGYSRSDSGSTKYAGSPLRILTDARLSLGSHLSVRLAAEKDAGEYLPLRGPGTMPAIDFVTATLDVSEVGMIESATVGDYVAHWGWGLILGRPTFTIGSAPKRPRAKRVAPYRGLAETGVFRGIALLLKPGDRLSVAAFASRARVDARVDTSLTGGIHHSLVTADGLHRTETEASRRNLLAMEVAGGYLSARNGVVEAGVGGCALRFDKDVLRGDRPDQRHDFQGSSQWSVSAFVSVTARHVRTSAEIAAVDGRWSGVAFGGVLPVNSSWTVWTYFRSVATSPRSLLGSIPQRRSSQLADEGGITFGAQYRIRGRLMLRAAYDLHWFDWLRFGLLTPTDGKDLSIAITSRVGRTEIHLRSTTREAYRPAILVTESGTPIKTSERSRTWRISSLVRIPLTENVDVDMRYGTAVGRDESGHLESGHIVAFDLRLAVLRWVDMRTRFALFDSASGASRVFAHESGLSHDFSIPSFSGRGERAYIVIQLQPMRRLLLRLKYSRTRWPGSATVGSGLDETPGDSVRAVGGELRISV